MADANISGSIGEIRVILNKNAGSLKNSTNVSFEKAKSFEFTEYNIKETDYRIKTATFTSPVFFDLTKGQHLVSIQSLYHENFGGVILDVDYDEKTGLYTYQCQDWSRLWISKFEAIGKYNVYWLLRSLITRFNVPYGTSYAKLKDNGWAKVVSGLKAKDKYNQSYYTGNKYKGNPLDQTRQLLIRDKSYIEVIRDLVYNSLGYYDVWFNQKGVLQITPLSKTDWESTGLHLTAEDYTSRKFNFSTTNAITSVIVNGSDLKGGSAQKSESLIDLNLNAFFGSNATSISNPNNNTKAVTSSSKKSTSTTSKSTTTSNNGNPFNKKAKRIIVCEDRGGTPGFKSGIIKKLKADGWSVKDLGTGPGTHSKSYDILSSKYAVNLTIYNGVDPETVREPVTGWCKNKHKKYGVQLVQMWDSHGWTSKKGKYNKKGMWYHRHGDMTDYKVPKAWDDNYSGVAGGVRITDLDKWYRAYYPYVIHCAGVSVSEAYSQFKAGGYYKYKGIKVK